MASNSPDEAQQQMQLAILAIINDVDKTHLRQIQLGMHRCAATCCENKVASMEEVQECVQKCSKAVQDSQKIVQQEITNLQNRLELCVNECQTGMHLDGHSDPKAQAEFFETFNKCAIKCFDDHRISSLPTVARRIKNGLESVFKNSNV